MNAQRSRGPKPVVEECRLCGVQARGRRNATPISCGTARPRKFMSKLHRRQVRVPRSQGHDPIDGLREKNERPER